MQHQPGQLGAFTLPPHAVSKAMAHRTAEEVWYFASGRGQMWRRLHDREEVVDVEPGVAISIPVGTHFQFRSVSHGPLTAVGTTMPPLPGEDEAFAVDGVWDPTG
ncbi:cupin domain-containing protein [Microvirga sp. VF16]|uniref:cupin domain-containing protein n=1 Tax=Microvirga sp. VF16 TaxID=2807101 RepID=UPI001FEE41B3|nr:cupin domain-containing protein [Microvirga sp. VF16]